MKKRRINEKATVDENDTIVASNIHSSDNENVTRNDNATPTVSHPAKIGPHGALLNRLFNKEEPKQYMEDESKREDANGANHNNTMYAKDPDAVITDESGHTMASKGHD